MASTQFRDQTVLITGASSGIGRALASALAKQGANVALVARNEPKLRELERDLAQCPGQRLVAPADVAKPEQVERAIAATLERFGRIDVLVNNAGKGFCGSVEQTSLEEFRDLFDTNFFGAFHFTRSVAQHMIQRRSGIIIQISSLNGFCAVPLGSAYCASKFALEAMSKSARLELHKHNVHVLIVRPGLTDTEFFDRSKNFHERNPFPLRRLMNEDDVAAKILRAAARRRRDLVLTADGKMLWWLMKFSPRLVDRILMQYANNGRAASNPA
jgi:short-subunit dehydrogenase